jgi:hypothetical protein
MFDRLYFFSYIEKLANVSQDQNVIQQLMFNITLEYGYDGQNHIQNEEQEAVFDQEVVLVPVSQDIKDSELPDIDDSGTQQGVQTTDTMSNYDTKGFLNYSERSQFGSTSTEEASVTPFTSSGYEIKDRGEEGREQAENSSEKEDNVEKER